MQDQDPEKAVTYLRVKVVDHTKEGRPAVNIKVPIGVVKWGMEMALNRPGVSGGSIW